MIYKRKQVLVKDFLWSTDCYVNQITITSWIWYLTIVPYITRILLFIYLFFIKVHLMMIILWRSIISFHNKNILRHKSIGSTFQQIILFIGLWHTGICFWVFNKLYLNVYFIIKELTFRQANPNKPLKFCDEIPFLLGI